MDIKNALTLIPISNLVESKTNPRTVFNPQEDKELMESIKSKGILDPLSVRELKDKKGFYEIVDGARRFRAAKEAGGDSVPCVIHGYLDDEVLEIQLISFTQKSGIHPLDEAKAYNELVKKKYTIEQIALKVSKERSYIAKRLKLVTLIDPAKEALGKGTITLPMALEIACLLPEQQKEALKACTDPYDRMDLADLKKFISNEFLLNLDGAPFKKDDATLLPKAGACSVCPKMTGNNPDLFGDVRGKKCTDGKCFREKIKAT